MSYTQNNVTFIDDLPLLDDLEPPKTHGLTMIPQTEVNKYQKFVRNAGHSPHSQSGMMSNHTTKNITPISKQIYEYNEHDHNIQQLHRNINPSHHSHPSQHSHYNTNNQYNPYKDEMVYENYEDNNDVNVDKNNKDNKINKTKLKKYKHETLYNDNNCVDIAEHVTNCIVCSKLYTNNNTVFILIIIFLAIVNLLLLKRILETEKH